MGTQVAAVEPAASLRFRTGAAMLSRLGSEQLKDEITAVMELVKNAYDADVTAVIVEVRDTVDGQRLVMQDDGSGMALEELHCKWAFAANPCSVSNP